MAGRLVQVEIIEHYKRTERSVQTEGTSRIILSNG